MLKKFILILDRIFKHMYLYLMLHTAPLIPFLLSVRLLDVPVLRVQALLKYNFSSHICFSKDNNLNFVKHLIQCALRFLKFVSPQIIGESSYQ